MSQDYPESPETACIRFIPTGYGTFVQAKLVVGGSDAESAPIKDLRREATEKGHLLNYAKGHKVRTVLRMVNEDIVLSALEPDTILRRLNGKVPKKTKRQGLEDL